MITLNTTVFAVSRKPNTFIGGVGDIITNRFQLSVRLGIAPARIDSFRLRGLDIECRISGNYDFDGASSAIFPNTLTHFIDKDKLLKVAGNYSFDGMNNLTIFEAYGLQSFGNGGQPKFTNSLVEELYLPSLGFPSGQFGNSDIINNYLLKRFIAPKIKFLNVGNGWLANSPLMELIDLRQMKQIGRSTTPFSRGDVFTNVGSASIPGVGKFHQDIVSVASDGGNPDINMMKLYNKGWQIKLYDDAGIYVEDFTI